MVWVLNQAFLGRLPSQTSAVPTVEPVDGGNSVTQRLGRGFAMAYVRIMGICLFFTMRARRGVEDSVLTGKYFLWACSVIAS